MILLSTCSLYLHILKPLKWKTLIFQVFHLFWTADFFFPSICTSVRAREKLYIPQWNARWNFLIISRAGCETASGPGLGSLAGVDCRVQWSVTGRDRGNSCVQVRGYDFILQLHLCVYRAFHQESREIHACCASFSFGCCRHDCCNKSFLYLVGL